MIVPDPMVKGGIASVVNGYRNSMLEKDFKVTYIESYCEGNKLNKLLKAMIGYLSYIKVLTWDKPDLVHIHSSFGSSFYRKVLFIYLSRIAKVHIFNHIHGAEFDDFYTNASPIKKVLIKNTYEKCDKLIALSDEWKEKLSQIVSPENITVIENYSIIVDNVVRHKCNKRILFLGEIGKRKGCYDIPAVVEKVERKIQDCKFILAGTGEINNIKALLRKRGVENNVVFPGWLRGKEKDEQLRKSDVFFLPSYNEGMPMSVLEAMGYGLPIVSTNVGGIPRIVHNSKNGYICQPGDTDGFAKAIIEILQDAEELKAFSNCSYEIVREKYSLESHLKLIEELYQKY